MSDDIMGRFTGYGGTFNAPAITVVNCGDGYSAPLVITILNRPNIAAAKDHYQELLDALDRDGPLVPLSPKPAPFREYEAQKHDFLRALHQPYVPPV